MLTNPIQMPPMYSQNVKPPVVTFSSDAVSDSKEQTNFDSSKITYSKIDNSYLIRFIPQTALSVDLSGVSSAVIGSDGINIDEEFSKNNAKLKNSLERIVKDKNTDGQWLKWIDLPQKQLKKVPEIQTFVENNVRNKVDDVVVLAIGGSSLGAKAIVGALSDSQWNFMSKEQRNGYPRIHFVENIDPDKYSEVMDKLDLSKTMLVVSSKSGTTPETSATYLNAKERMFDAVEKGQISKDELKNHFVMITDNNPEKSILMQEAVKNGYKTYDVPDDVSGRYSLFSDSGIVPAAMVGIDIKSLLEGAVNMTKVCSDASNLKENPAANQALIHYLEYKKGKDYSVIVPYSEKLSGLTDWYAKLWSESLGKKINKEGKTENLNHGAIRGMGAVDHHSQLQLWRDGKNDKVFTFINIKNFNKNVPIAKNSTSVPDKLGYMRDTSINKLISEEAKTAMKMLEKENRPVINIELPQINSYNLGALMQSFLFQTAVLGELEGLGIDTYKQPAVDDVCKKIKENMQN